MVDFAFKQVARCRSGILMGKRLTKCFIWDFSKLSQTLFCITPLNKTWP